MTPAAYLALVEGGYGEFTVSVPDLPGCYAEGETREEAIENAQAAAAEWMDRNRVTPRARTRAELLTDLTVGEVMARGGELAALDVS